MKKYISILLIFMIILSSVLTGCGSKKPADTINIDAPDATDIPVKSDTPERDHIIIGQYGDAPSLDPHNSLNDNAMRVMINIYDPLVRMDEKFKPVPCIAEDWEVSEDGTEYIFHIRKGIKFHNGDELKVSDVVFSINRGIQSPQASPSYNGVLSAEALDNNSVKVKLKGINKQLLAAFSLPLAGIVNEKVVTEYEQKGVSYGREPIGTGPYKLSNWVTGEKIELVAFDDYFLGKAKTSNVTFRAIEDQSAAVISLEKGDIDAYVDLNSSNFNKVNQNQNLTLHLGPSFAYQYVAFNCSKAPFDNLKVRQAIAHAIDKESMVIGVADGNGEIIDTIASKDMVGYTDKTMKYEYNLEKAKELLIEAGYSNGFECDIAVYLDNYSKYAQVLQASLDEIGIKANVVFLERAAFDDLSFSGKSDIIFYGNTFSGPDLSDPSIYNVLHSSNITRKSSRIQYKNEKLDKILDEARNTLDDDIRAKLYEEMLILLSEEVPLVPFIWTYKNIAANKNLDNVYAHPQSIYYVYDYQWN